MLGTNSCHKGLKSKSLCKLGQNLDSNSNDSNSQMIYRYLIKKKKVPKMLPLAVAIYACACFVRYITRLAVWQLCTKIRRSLHKATKWSEAFTQGPHLTWFLFSNSERCALSSTHISASVLNSCISEQHLLHSSTQVHLEVATHAAYVQNGNP